MSVNAENSGSPTSNARAYVSATGDPETTGLKWGESEAGKEGDGARTSEAAAKNFTQPSIIATSVESGSTGGTSSVQQRPPGQIYMHRKESTVQRQGFVVEGREFESGHVNGSHPGAGAATDCARLAREEQVRAAYGKQR